MPHREAQVGFDFARGWDNQWSTINFAKDQKLIPESAADTDKTFLEALKKLKWDGYLAADARKKLGGSSA
jgi:hypothetical protein